MMADASIIPITIAIILTTAVEAILIEEVAAVAVVGKTGRTEAEVMASTTEDQGVEVAAEVAVVGEVAEMLAIGDKILLLNLFFLLCLTITLFLALLGDENQ